MAEMQQTQQTQQTVVIQQQPIVGMVAHQMMPVGLAGQDQKGWSTGLCGCFDDCGSCMMGWCCLACLTCSVAMRMRESCCVPFFLQGGLMAMRTKLRTMYGIEGSICCDCLATTFCSQLVVCQMDREMKHWNT